MDAAGSLATFDAHAAEWDAYTSSPLGRLRRESTLRGLLPLLPGPPASVLDVGGGTGADAAFLAARGHRVRCAEPALGMLELARRRLDEAGPGGQVTLLQAGAESLPGLLVGETFDAICCHALLEYLADPLPAVRGLAGLLAGGGLLSVLLVNPAADVLRAAVRGGDPRSALAHLHRRTSPAGLFGVSRACVAPADLLASLSPLGLSPLLLRGVRVLSDYLPAERLDDPDFFAEVSTLEDALAGHEGFFRVARYLHVVLRKTAT